MANNANNNKRNDLKSAAKMAKKVAPSKSQRKKIYKSSGFSRAIPYITVGIGLLILLFFILGAGDGSGVVGELLQLFLFGTIGGSAYLLPLILGYTGIMWCILHVKESSKRKRSSNDDNPKSSGRSRTVRKTVLSVVFIFLFSTFLGVVANADSFDIATLWEEGSEGAFVAGGVIGGAFGYLFTVAFKQVISIILLVIGLLITLFFALGFSVDSIVDKVTYRKELRKESFDDGDDDGDDGDDERARYEAMKKKEYEKARLKKMKAIEAERKREIRRIKEQAAMDAAEEMGYSDEEDEPELVVPPVMQQAPQRKREPAAQVQTFNDEDFLNHLDEEADAKVDLKVQEAEIMDADFGGDPILDEGAQSVEELLRDIQTAEPEPVVKPVAASEDEIELEQISKETIAEDLADVVPDEGEGEEMVTPYIFPPIEMLSVNKNPVDTDVHAELQENARLLKETLKSFKVEVKDDISYSRGPTITRYELKPEVGTRVRTIANLVDDISLSLATSGVRIEAPIPNKAAVGIEVPNRTRATVYLRDLIENPKFTDAKSRLTSCLGMDVGGNPVYFDISKMPHMLIAGATGMGKSVCINSVIVSILYKARPSEVKLILIDPKKVEFSMYRDIPHLYAPIVSDPKKAAGALASAVSEMERRFELIEEVGMRDIAGYNEATENDPEKEHRPHMVIIIDELADLMMTASDEVESCICRLAQKARAAGIHLIIGTQRPSVDVITGLIKANIPSRIACTVTSQVDSRTIIDIAGAEKLIGRGDMLFAPVGASKPMRVQGAFVSENEIEKIVSFLKANNSAAKYNSAFISSMEENAKLCGMGKKAAAAAMAEAESGDSEGGDSKFRDAVKLAIEEGKISTSLMQRRLSVGYGRAAKIIDTMEQLGYVSRPDGNKPRRVLITMEEYMNRVSEGTLGDSEE